MTHPALAGAADEILWSDPTLHETPDARAPLDGDTDLDVAIVGGGFSGLWTAYYLIRDDPSLRVGVVEKHRCGFGASGRNGGWAIGELAGSFQKYAARSSAGEALRQARTVFDAVDEIGRVAVAEGIDCDYAKGGTIRVARNAPQAARQAAEIAELHHLGFTPDEVRLLTAEEARTHLGATDVRSGIFFAPTAALHPVKALRGLAAVVEAAGVRIWEDTTVQRIDDGAVVTDRGTLRAAHTVRATEAYTRDLAGDRRAVLPIYSYMIATEPLPAHAFDEIGLHDRQTFADDRYMVIYGQRTADDRLAFGGTGVPYRFASGISRDVEFDLGSHESVHRILGELFPGVASTPITHRWGGVLAIPRDWVPGLTWDRGTGRGEFGGYVGEGVAAANLAGRTMADLIAGHDTDRTSLPWVGARARRWEPEPLRWLGVRSSRRILAMADRSEFATDERSRIAFRISRLLRGA